MKVTTSKEETNRFVALDPRFIVHVLISVVTRGDFLFIITIKKGTTAGSV